MALPLKDNRGQLFFSVVLSNEEPSIKGTRACVIYKLCREKITGPHCILSCLPHPILKASAKKKKKKRFFSFLHRIVNTCYNLKPVQ